jgi:uncharacterized membrane protein
MNRLAMSLFTVGLAAMVGCENKSPPGGPGAVRSDGTKPSVGTPDNSFRVTVANLDLKQGESKTVAVGIVRGTSFDQDVKLAVDSPPQGVTVKFDNDVLKASVKEVQMTVTASAEAALGEHKVNLTATPAKAGPATPAEFTIEVKKPS